MRLIAILSLFCCTAALHADDKAKNPLAAARARWLKGNFAEARELFQEQLKDEKSHVGAAIGIARTHLSEGDARQALDALNAGLKSAEDHPDLLAARADVNYQVGDWDGALKDAEQALKAQDEHFLARWVRARITRDRGDMKNADQEMRWFVRAYNRRVNTDAEIKNPDDLLIVGQASAEYARWHSLSDQFETILSDIYLDMIKIEPECWIAEWLAGEMLLEKVNLPEAVKSFDNALKINPRAAEAFVGKGLAAITVYETKEAENFADQALKINPRLTAALRLRADICLLSGEFDKALHALEQAQAVNAREESTRGRFAACQFLLKHKDQFNAAVADVQKINPSPGVFYHDLAYALEQRRFYIESEKYYRLALEANDKLAGPKNALGLLYLRLGKEAEAKELLDKAFKFDPFNVRVANSRKVLKHLASYESIESPHYIVRFDPKTDRILAEFVLEFLEEVHAGLAKDFNFQPDGKILVEVFNSHEMFSGRTVNLPDLHTIGACTGRVVTMVSPHGKGLTRTFNWARVIRHELVHVFNLAQTDFQAPHWLTEGLAVRNEGIVRPPNWNAVLRERQQKNELFNLDNILLGFVRPRSPDEWTLAYCQSLLYVEYLIKAHGIGAVGKMLDAYGAGLGAAAAIKKVCSVEQAEFEKGYRAYVDDIVKSIPVPVHADDKTMTLKELEQAHEKNPDDVEVAAKLAAEYLRRKNVGEAKKLAERVLEKKPGHPVASIVKARWLGLEGDETAARKLLESSVTANPDDIRVRNQLGKMCLASKEYAAAAEQFEKCRRLDPLNSGWLLQLRDLYAKLEDVDKLADVLRAIAENDADDLPTRKQLAKLLLDKKEYAEAEEVAREAMHIDVLDVQARQSLLQALREQKKDAAADKIAARFGKDKD
jgi:cellulose synthase operon protein C